MHCLLKWIATPASKSQCPMDRRPWETAEGKVNRSNAAAFAAAAAAGQQQGG